MLSMTGYGSGQATEDGCTATVELRVVNHKQCDVRIRGQALPHALLVQVEKMCRDHLGRGRVEVTITMRDDRRGPEAFFDLERTKDAWKALEILADELDAPRPSLETLLRMPNLITDELASIDAPSRMLNARRALGQALNATNAMRKEEGALLTHDMKARLNKLSSMRAQIEGLAETLTTTFRDALRARVAALTSDGTLVDEDRIAKEVVLYAAKADITEETVRLTSHFAQLVAMFASEESVGKKIDFLLQEVSREVNTIASKVNDANVAQIVVAMKTEVARLREQALNIL